MAFKERRNSTTGLATWFVSNCQSRSGREKVVEKLKRNKTFYKKFNLKKKYFNEMNNRTFSQRIMFYVGIAVSSVLTFTGATITEAPAAS